MEKYKVIERSKGTGSTFSLLSKGMIPGIVYGKGTEPTKIAFENKQLLKLMESKGFYTKVLNIEIDGKNMGKGSKGHLTNQIHSWYINDIKNLSKK